MNRFRKKDIHDGLLSNNTLVLQWVVELVHAEVKKKVTVWINGEYNVLQITQDFVTRKIKNFKGNLLRKEFTQDNCTKDELKRFFLGEIYKDLFTIPSFFHQQRQLCQFLTEFKLPQNIEDRTLKIDKICTNALKAFIKGYVEKNTANNQVCRIQLLIKVLNIEINKFLKGL